MKQQASFWSILLFCLSPLSVLSLIGCADTPKKNDLETNSPKKNSSKKENSENLAQKNNSPEITKKEKSPIPQTPKKEERKDVKEPERWFPQFSQAVTEARAENAPILIDFTGET